MLKDDDVSSSASFNAAEAEKAARKEERIRRARQEMARRKMKEKEMEAAARAAQGQVGNQQKMTASGMPAPSPAASVSTAAGSSSGNLSANNSINLLEMTPPGPNSGSSQSAQASNQLTPQLMTMMSQPAPMVSNNPLPGYGNAPDPTQASKQVWKEA